MRWDWAYWPRAPWDSCCRSLSGACSLGDGLQVRSSTGACAFDETWLQGITRRLHPRHIGRSPPPMQPLLAILIAGLIAAPWYLLVGQQTNGVWLREFFLEHNVGLARLCAMEGHQGNPLLYYPIAILVGCFPWSVFAMPIAIWTWRRRHHPTHSQPMLPNAHVFLLADRRHDRGVFLPVPSYPVM